MVKSTPEVVIAFLASRRAVLPRARKVLRVPDFPVLSEQKDGKNHALTTTVAVKVLVLISVGLFQSLK
jgi:hypothetical protein